MDQRELLLNTIKDLSATINDTLNQVSMLGDKVQRGTLTTDQAEEFRKKWEYYVKNTAKMEQIMMDELFRIAIK